MRAVEPDFFIDLFRALLRIQNGSTPSGQKLMQIKQNNSLYLAPTFLKITKRDDAGKSILRTTNFVLSNWHQDIINVCYPPRKNYTFNSSSSPVPKISSMRIRQYSNTSVFKIAATQGRMLYGNSFNEAEATKMLERSFITVFV